MKVENIAEEIESFRDDIDDARSQLLDLANTLSVIADDMGVLLETINTELNLTILGVTDIPEEMRKYPNRSWSERSLKSMEGIHPALRQLCDYVLYNSPIDIMIIEGLRTEERQQKLVNSGASKTLKSKHLTGHAVDFVPLMAGEVSWDWPHFNLVAPAWKKGAEKLGVNIIWGGDWDNFQDGPHIQIDPYTTWVKRSWN